VPSGVLGAAPPSPPPPSLPPGAVRVGGRVREPARLKYVAPVYPARAKQSRVQGVVVLECTISPEGKVTSTRVVRSVPLLDAAAQAAVAQWEYEPTRVDGKAVPVIMTVTVRFSLR
jgi:protein TonB